MRKGWWLVLAVALVAQGCSKTDVSKTRDAGAAQAAALPQIAPTFADYDADYVQTELRGWTVIVNRRLLETEQALSGRALALLDTKLADIERTVYRFPLRRLQRVPIWIEGGSSGLRGLAYHWSADWLRDHGYDPRKAHAVEIHSVRDFLDWTPGQPWLVMHELAHAYHDRALGEHNADIAAAYENARGSGAYDNVRYRDGSTRRAYAMNNRMEYFAELSESYHGVNDFFPFTRAELERHDPQGYALMEKVWRN